MLRCVPPDASQVQLEETRRGFYAGVLTAVNLLAEFELAGPAERGQRMRGFSDELRQYLKSLEAAR